MPSRPLAAEQLLAGGDRVDRLAHDPAHPLGIGTAGDGRLRGEGRGDGLESATAEIDGVHLDLPGCVGERQPRHDLPAAAWTCPTARADDDQVAPPPVKS